MGKDVKGIIPTSGDWVAVYASDESENWTLRTQPVAFWIWQEEGDAAEFVGGIDFGPNMILATSPDLLGYARHDEDIYVKFRHTLEDYKRESVTESGAALVREIRSTAPPEPMALCSCCDPPMPLASGEGEHWKDGDEDEDEDADEPKN